MYICTYVWQIPESYKFLCPNTHCWCPQLVNAMKTVWYFDVSVVDYKFRLDIPTNETSSVL